MVPIRKVSYKASYSITQCSTSNWCCNLFLCFIFGKRIDNKWLTYL